MAVLKDCADSDGELFIAFSATMQASADALGFVLLDFPDVVLLGVFAVRTNRAVRPQDAFNVFARRFIGGEMLLNFHQR